MSIKRKIEVKMRLTEDELGLLHQRMDDAEIKNREHYLRKMALTGYILRLNMSEVRETLRLMTNATSNINQLAKCTSETRSIYANDMKQLHEDVNGLRAQVSAVMKVFSKVHQFMEL